MTDPTFDKSKYAVPDIGISIRPMHEALAYFLQNLEFPVYGLDDAENVLVVGRNLFVDRLPLWFKELDEPHQSNPGDTWILITNESLDSPSSEQSHNQKLNSLAIIESHHSNSDRAATDMQRLFHCA